MAFFDRLLSTNSAEELLREILNIQNHPEQAGEDPQTGHARAQTANHSLPYLSPPPPISPQLPSLYPVPYLSYFTSISTFTTPIFPPGSSVYTTDMIREFMALTCRENGTELHHCTLKVSLSDIPGGKWTVAFMPGVLQDGGWVVMFGVPELSEYVWALWPQARPPKLAPPHSNPTDTQNLSTTQGDEGEYEPGEEEMMEFFANLGVLREVEGGVDRGEAEMIQFFANLISDDSLIAQQDMKVGDERHKKAYAVVQQALWMEKASNSFLKPDWRSGEFGGLY